MDTDTETKSMTELVPAFSFNDWDDETIAILVDDMIATGG